MGTWKASWASLWHAVKPVLDFVLERGPSVHAGTVWASIAVALIIVAVPWFWHLVKLPVTMMHESGHAAAGSLVRRDVEGIRLNRDSSGFTLVEDGGRLGNAFALFWGYPGPFVVAALILVDVSSGLWNVGFIVLAVVCARVLVEGLQVRSLLTMAVAGVSAGALVAGLWYLPDDAKVALLVTIAWVLIFGGLRGLVTLWHVVHEPDRFDSDAHMLGQQLFGGPRFWWGVLTLTSLGLCALSLWLSFTSWADITSAVSELTRPAVEGVESVGTAFGF